MRLVISEQTYRAIVNGTTAVCVCALVFLYLRYRVNRARGRRTHGLARWWPVAVLAMSFVLGRGVASHYHTRVVAVGERDGKLAAVTWRDAGTQPGFVLEFGPDDDTVVINDSTRAVILGEITYTTGTPKEPRTMTVWPQQTVRTRVDYVGPDDRPPTEIEIKKSRYDFSVKSESRVWLTWE